MGGVNGGTPQLGLQFALGGSLSLFFSSSNRRFGIGSEGVYSLFEKPATHTHTHRMEPQVTLHISVHIKENVKVERDKVLDY